jgi:starch phosphorylase
MLMADYEAYIAKQFEVASTFLDSEKWLTMAIYNVARMGKFSTDRTIKEYAEDIWHIKPLEIKIK